tara:strand:- start:299 stop:688 length:390 start_codon:yes stop_codon:yes gene_type:complete
MEKEMKVTRKQLRKIIKESMGNMDDMYVEKINALLLADDGVGWERPSYDQAMELLAALPHLKDHPNLRIYSAYENYDGEVIGSRLTKEEAMSFDYHGSDPVRLVSREYEDGQHGRMFAYEYLEDDDYLY